MRLSITILILFSITACAGRNRDYKSPKGYDLNHPIIFKMHESLHEISGIAFHNSNSDTIYAEQDEEGAVYALHLEKDYKRKVEFKKQGDFEDIAICNEEVFMLRSDGKIYSFPFKELQNENIKSEKKWENFLPDGEYEGMYAQNSTNKLYVLCKNCQADKKQENVSGYIFQFNPQSRTLSAAGNFQIESNEIAVIAGLKKIKFKPSALAQNPKTKEWYLLSSVNKMLVITDQNWQVKQVYNLDPNLFVQPEGIAFDHKNTLYISNEGSQIKAGTIFKFVPKTK